MGSKPRPSLFLAFLGCAVAAPTGAAQRDGDFMKAFRQALEINAKDEMASLVKARPNEAILAVVETCELISKGTNDALENDIDALRVAWKNAFGTGFVAMEYEYFSVELQGEFKNARAKVVDQFRAQRDLFLRARENKEKRALQGFGLDYLTLGRSFEELGDLYRASECYQLYAECFDEALLAQDADFGRVIQGLDYMVEMRGALELADPLVEQAKARRDSLVSKGYVSAEGSEEETPSGGGAEETPEPAVPGAAAPAGPIALGGAFELVPELEEVRRPGFGLDALYPIWGFIFFKADHPDAGAFPQTGVFPGLDDSPKVIREGANKVLVDVDGDGKGDVEIPVTGKINPVEITLGQGAARRKWAFLATVGTEQDTYQGVRPYNLAPAMEQMLLYIAPAASIVGNVAGTRVQIFDDNLDGRFGSPPKGWAYTGLREQDFQYDVDTIRIGDSERAVPWSELVEVGPDWYEFHANDSGTDVTVQKTSIKTGTIKLDCKGYEPDFLIVRGRDKIANVFLDVAAGGSKGVAVPTGTYELFFGRASKGKRDQTAKALIVPTPVTPPCRVEAGKAATIQLGEPFLFDFSLKQDDQSVTIEGKSILVTGRGKETYQRLWNCAVQPAINVRKAGTTKDSEEGKMRTAQTQEQARDLGYLTLWYPIDVTLPKKKEGEKVEVQLTEKKNKLFGKIESVWKN